MPLHSRAAAHLIDTETPVNPLYAELDGEGLGTVPKYRLREGSMPPEVAAQIVRDELLLDGTTKLNLATFVTTWMEPEANRLLADCLDKNLVNRDEYPQTGEIEHRCVNMIAHLWHAAGQEATGCSTGGSSEGVMLGGLAMKWRWRRRRQRAGHSHDRPNLVLGTTSHVCWYKFCRYWDVEPREVPVELDRMHLDPKSVLERCDENTIGVVAVMGSTVDGRYDPIAEIGAALDDLGAKGVDVPIHVDAASGGFVAPFLHPDVAWDFRVPRVQSINASGHKYGLVYPGLGWIVWRDAQALPDDLVFKVNVLGGEQRSFSMNFSRPGAHVIAQYYQFLRLGHEGYRRIMQTCQSVAHYLAGELATIEPLELISDGSDLPVVAVRLSDDAQGFTVFDVADRLRQRGWQIPAYALPANLENVPVLRFVIRNGFSRDLAEALAADIRATVEMLHAHPHPLPDPGGMRESFKH